LRVNYSTNAPAISFVGNTILHEESFSHSILTG
jgi:hypothetical protein